MDNEVLQAVTQITLDEDRNIPDSQPDIEKIILKSSEVRLEETKVMEDKVSIRGTLFVRILYVGDNHGNSLSRFEAEMPFEDIVNVEGAHPTDVSEVYVDSKDITCSIINSRKVNLQVVLTLLVNVEKTGEREFENSVLTENLPETLEYRKKTKNILETCLLKKDIYRVREDVELPSNLPNIAHVLWDYCRPINVEIKPYDEKLAVTGEVLLFVLYEAEGEEGMTQWYETSFLFSGEVECRECREEMISDTHVTCARSEVELTTDLDGENRLLSVDLALDLFIKLYQEKQIQVLTDVYGVREEVIPQTGTCHFKSLQTRNSGKCRSSEHLHVNEEGTRILQICHSEGNVKVDEIHPVENGISVDGVVEVQILYITADDKIPFSCVTGNVPFHFVSEVAEMEADSRYEVDVTLEQLTTTITSGDEIEVKVVLGIHTIVFGSSTETIITDIRIEPVDPVTIKSLPGMIGYFVAPGDTLWQIGKQYYVPVSRIKELNGLPQDELTPGMKLVIMR